MVAKGLTKDFLRFTSRGSCNAIASPNCNLCCFDKRIYAVGAAENVHVWNLRTGEKIGSLHGGGKTVSCIALSKVRQTIAVGYSDGSIGIWDANALHEDEESEDPKLTLAGHKSPISSMDFSPDGLLLVSGGKDSTVIVWDVVAEAGLCKLKGHKGPITRVRITTHTSSPFVVSSSKDSFIKFWDLDTKHCFFTIPAHRTEIWDFVLLNQDSVLVTGSSELELQTFKLNWRNREIDNADSDKENAKKPKSDNDESQNTNTDQGSQHLTFTKTGTVLRKVKGRVSQLQTSPDEKILICVGTSHFFDVFRIISDEEKKTKLEKQLRKAKKKNKSEAEIEGMTAFASGNDFLLLGDIRCPSKPKSIAFETGKEAPWTIGVVLGNNSVLELNLELGEAMNSINSTQLAQLTAPGHRTDIRSVAFFADNMSFGSVSEDSVKIWNRGSLQPIRTFPCEQALCLKFAPGDRHCVVGTKTGKLLLFDIAGAAQLAEVPAHGDSAVWSLAFAENQTFLSGGADKKVKFWTFCMAKAPDEGNEKVLTFKNNRSLELPDEVLCLAVSGNQKFLAVGLLDNTARVYFMDTLKFFLSLYGHSLPVLCLDISSDSSLVVTGSADKNVKIWGLDFGDCHRSLFAHDDSVTAVKFVPKSHLFFSAGKDGKVKQWDADKFNRIQVLEPSASLETWALSVSPNGKYVVAASHDKTIRVWEESEEILVLGEEEEVEREKQDEEAIENEEDVIAGEIPGEVDLASKRTLDSVKGAENIIEALEIRTAEKEEGRNELDDSSHPLMKALKSKSVDHFIMDVIKRIRASDLEKALLLVPFGYCLSVLEALSPCIESGYRTELACKAVLFITKIHHNQMLNSPKATLILDKLRHSLPKQVEEIKDTIGFNFAALKMMQAKLEEDEEVKLFSDHSRELKSKKSAKKRKEAYLLQVA